MAYKGSRTIDGKRYSFLSNQPTKAAAQKVAESGRAKGYKIRVIGTKTGYALYGRKTS